MSSAIKITKLGVIKTTDADDIKSGVVGFEMVRFEYEFYGNKQSDIIDTKVMADGRQIVIDGNGFIKAGTEI